MRLGTFFLKLDYYFREKKEEFKFKGNLIRMQTYFYLNIHLEKKNQLKAPDELWKFDWDEKEIISFKSEKDVKVKVNSLLNTLNKVIDGKS